MSDSSPSSASPGAGVSDSSSLNAPSPRDVARAMLDAGGDLHVAARELGCDEFDLAQRVAKKEVKTLLQQRAEAEQVGRAILSDSAQRNALLVLNAVATQPLDDPELSPSERIRHAENVRRASVDILRLAVSLSGKNGGDGKRRRSNRAHKKKKKKSESPAERRQRIQREAIEKLNRVMEADVGPEEWDRRQRLSARLKKHRLTFVPQLPGSGWKIDFDHPFCVELAAEEPDIIEKMRKDEHEFDQETRRIRETPRFSDPREATRYYRARAAAEAKANAKASPGKIANANGEGASPASDCHQDGDDAGRPRPPPPGVS